MAKTGMLSLNARKMEKNFIAVIEKGYPRNPQYAFDIGFLLSRIYDEVDESREAYFNYQNRGGDLDDLLDELADISNLVDFVFEIALDKWLLKGGFNNT